MFFFCSFYQCLKKKKKNCIKVQILNRHSNIILLLWWVSKKWKWLMDIELDRSNGQCVIALHLSVGYESVSWCTKPHQHRSLWIRDGDAIYFSRQFIFLSSIDKDFFLICKRYGWFNSIKSSYFSLHKSSK